MKQIRDLAELRSEATPGPLWLETIHGHGAERDSHLIPGALRERYGDNALNFGEDRDTTRFVEAALRDVPAIASGLRRAEAALARAEAAHEEGNGLRLGAALAELRSILSPDA